MLTKKKQDELTKKPIKNNIINFAFKGNQVILLC